MLGLRVHLLPVLGQCREIPGPEAAQIACKWLLAGVRVSVADQNAFRAEILSATGMIAVELSNFFMNNLIMFAISHKAGEGLLANRTSFVVTMVSLEVIGKMLFSRKGFRAEVALEHPVDLVVESLQRDILLNTDCVVAIAALEMRV